MPFDPTLAARRFGMGLSPIIAAPSSVTDMMDLLAGPDDIAAQISIPTFTNVVPSALDFHEANRAKSAARGTDGEDAAVKHEEDLRAASREANLTFIKADIARAVHTQDGLRERLTRFWADHFTVQATRGINRHMVSPYIEEAIRPHVNGSFGNMLVAVVQSPMMIYYLNQHQSAGPNSRDAERRNGGLNENLARELLELHTLGVDGSYTQTDVRELAELLTGVMASVRQGPFFREHGAEPGPETVLGVTYGGDEESIDHVIMALHDLAVHPDTAHHLSRKLAVHFVSPDPDAGMIDAMSARYLETGGDLLATVETMLNAQAAWVPTLLKVKQPFDFVASSMRALAVPLDEILNGTRQEVRRIVQRPMSVMGQVLNSPVGPDGWPEGERAWITPQGMAGRITWSMDIPERLLDKLPDPREFVFHALGPNPPEPVLFAAGAAETVSDGIGIVLASAAFQRR